MRDLEVTITTGAQPTSPQARHAVGAIALFVGVTTLLLILLIVATRALMRHRRHLIARTEQHRLVTRRQLDPWAESARRLDEARGSDTADIDPDDLPPLSPDDLEPKPPPESWR